jgi:MraZ protein
MLRGNAPAKLDSKGRLKVPAAFRGYLEETYGREFYLTSDARDSILIYPLSVWESIEQKIDGLPQSDPSLLLYLDLVYYYGTAATMDAQGRILISPTLREIVGHAEEVSVLGKRRWLEVWNRDLLKSRISSIAATLTDDHRRELAKLGL